MEVALINNIILLKTCLNTKNCMYVYMYIYKGKRGSQRTFEKNINLPKSQQDYYQTELPHPIIIICGFAITKCNWFLEFTEANF